MLGEYLISFFALILCAVVIFCVGMCMSLIVNRVSYSKERDHLRLQEKAIDLRWQATSRAHDPTAQGNYPALEMANGQVIVPRPGNPDKTTFLTVTGKPEKFNTRPPADDYYAVEFYGEPQSIISKRNGEIYKRANLPEAKPQLAQPEIESLEAAPKMPEIAAPNSATIPAMPFFRPQSQPQSATNEDDFEPIGDEAQSAKEDFASAIPGFLTIEELELLSAAKVAKKPMVESIKKVTGYSASSKNKRYETIRLWWQAGANLPD